MSPTWNPDQKGVKVQIIDVFALELATGYEKDPEAVTARKDDVSAADQAAMANVAG